MIVGQNYIVSLTFKNIGSSTWTSANLYRLGSQNPQDNGTWNNGRVELSKSVGPQEGTQEEYTFTFNIRAPATPGTYDFRWRMVRDGVEWFGAYSSNLRIQVKSSNNTSATNPVPPPSSTAGNVPYFYLIKSSNTLANWDIDKAIDHNPDTIYSSQMYASAYPPANSLHIEAYLPNYATVRYLKMKARMFNGRPLAFPRSYRVHVTNSNNTKWIYTNNISVVPDSNGVALIDLGSSYYTTGLHLVIDQLGTDDFNNYYLQIAEMRFL